MYKRTLSMALTLLLVFSLCGCAAPPQADEGKLQVVATLFPYYDMAKALAGDRAEVTLLVSAGRESHSYEPTPLDIIRISECDLFLYNGGTDETWAAEVLETLPDVRAAAMMETVEALEEETAEGMAEERGHRHAHEHDEHEHEIEYDEHIWTSPVNAMRIARAIAENLTKADPAGAAVYEANLGVYLGKLAELDETFRAVTANGARNLLVFGDRFPFLYFCEEYGIDYRAAFLGCSTETEPSAATMAYLIDKVREERIPVVYTLENSSGRVARAIADASGAETDTFYSCQSITVQDFENGETYLSLMRRNAEALRKGLN